MTLRRIVVGVDSSEGSRRALRWTADLAQGTDTDVVVVHGKSHLVSEAEGEAVLEDAVHYLAEHAISVRSVMDVTDPRALLSGVAEREDADLIVIGSRGNNLLVQLALGSVGEYLTHHAPRPVTIVRYGPGRQPD